MKKVFLIGDSIRMGYDKYVAEQLAGEAEVAYSATTRSSPNTLSAISAIGRSS